MYYNQNTTGIVFVEEYEFNLNNFKRKIKRLTCDILMFEISHNNLIHHEI
jgi:hypothetical protein